uniref:Uncharacterized protein n=1 Tax=Neobodo designis TaxID=312471 RepID=A0A7S1PVG2_NEODS
MREQRLREQRSLRSETVPVADAEAPHVAVSLPHAPPPSSRATDTDPAQPAVRAAPTWPPAGLSPLPPFSTTGGPPFPPVPPLANQQQTLTASMANAPPRAPVPFPYSTLPPPPPPHPYAAMMTYHSAAVAAPGAAALPPFGILAYPGGAMPMAPFFHPPHLPQVPGRPF